MRFPWRAVLALVVLVGWFVVAAGLSAALAVAAVYAMKDGTVGLSGAVLAAAALLVGTATGLGAQSVLSVRVQSRGVVVERGAQPALWRVVGELARTARADAPDEVRVASEVTLGVVDNGGPLGLRRGRRCLEIGLPLLGGTTVAELRALVAHELGHHGNGGLTATVYRGAQALEHTVGELRRDLPRWGAPVLGWLLDRWVRVFVWAAGPVLTERECAADQAAMAAAGRRAAQQGLVRPGVLAAAWPEYGKQYLALARLAGRTPDVLLGFRAFLSAPARRHRWEQVEQEVLDAGPISGFDHHPPLRDRVAAMADTGEPGAEPDDRPAWMLLGEPVRSVPELEDALLVDLGPRAPWPELVRVAAVQRAEQRAAELARAVLDSGAQVDGRPAQPTIAGVLLALHRGLGAELVKPALDPALAPREVPEASVTTLVELVAGAAATALCRARRATFELDWNGPARLRLVGGQAVDLERLVAPAVHRPVLVPRLHQHLTRMGVPLDFAARPAEPPKATLAASACGVRRDGEPHDLLVYDVGLLVLPSTGGKLATKAAKKALTELRRRPGAHWICGYDVEWGRLVRRRSGWDLWLRLRGDAELELTGTEDTVQRGEPAEALAGLLGDRLEVEDVRQRRREPTPG
ncbi:hypothetical protein GCM10012275_13450 [Longimycelium tulufanense]|uniref:Peptidase M48 domain-containing protein n=1 Tax=Longimycelium tulufanense TaxID=907463 RepID=A0A8J3CBM9_9PSEU|nr:M48 family metallopeptidase [Longimycelium tulufanense]GGM43770.1 hypothetical protein GCM10012275_13450 [Longimycelium tulufanense]